MNIKIEDIKTAIERADKMQSDHAAETYGVPALTSLKLRHLLNNIGKLGTRFFECGSHRGGTFTATIAGNDNLIEVIANDSFESDKTMIAEEKAEPQFRANAARFLPKNTKLTIIVSDTFDINVSQLPKGIDIYAFDADHSEQSQRKALTYFLPALADEFIYLCDDWDFPEVESGTRKGLADGGFEILYETILKTLGSHDNDSWWNSFYVALLRKPKTQE